MQPKISYYVFISNIGFILALILEEKGEGFVGINHPTINFSNLTMFPEKKLLRKNLHESCKYKILAIIWTTRHINIDLIGK